MALLKKSNRFTNLILGLVYAIVYHYVYTNYMHEYFSYMYCPSSAPINEIFSYYLVFAATPLLFYKGFNSLASGLSFMVYTLMYIPMIYVTFIANIEQETMYFVIMSLYIFIIACFKSDQRRLYKKQWSKRSIVPFYYVEIATLIIIVFVLLIEGRSLKFVKILSQSDLMYDMRASYSSSRLAITGYLISWLKTAFLPLLLVYYLQSRNWKKYVLILIAYLIMFMLDMQKVTFVMPYVISLVYFVAVRPNFAGRFHIYILGFFSFFSCTLVATISNLLSYSIAAIFIMRMQCLDSWIFSLYLDFFESHPYTYYSHINIVNAITHSYPYKDALGVAVTEGSMNANASFLVTDGYAAMGIIGFFIIGIIFIILKSIFNSIDLKYNRNLVILTLFPAISAMLNVSLFTAIFSCGFLILYFIYMFVDLKQFALNEK